MLLWCNVGVAFPDVKAIRDGKVKIGMTQKELKKAIFWGTSTKHDPFWKGCSRKYFSDSKQEILIPRSQAVFFIFKNVTKPGKIKPKKCKPGNGTLQGFTYSLDDAFRLIKSKQEMIRDLTQDSAISQYLSGRKLDNIEGIWATKRGNITAIYKSGSTYKGVVIRNEFIKNGEINAYIEKGNDKYYYGNSV